MLTGLCSPPDMASLFSHNVTAWLTRHFSAPQQGHYRVPARQGGHYEHQLELTLTVAKNPQDPRGRATLSGIAVEHRGAFAPVLSVSFPSVAEHSFPARSPRKNQCTYSAPIPTAAARWRTAQQALS